ncbi:hypothetical protein [Bradyrhizobium sp. DASA03120]|uniref:hypothetical protein n=1 Tax=Bradyrhizobium sp. SMVTL-02 TaxID=3395917 RepID=UPI003F6E5F11
MKYKIPAGESYSPHRVVARCTNSSSIDLICKIIMPFAQCDVEAAKTRLPVFIHVQSMRAKPY